MFWISPVFTKQIINRHEACHAHDWLCFIPVSVLKADIPIGVTYTAANSASKDRGSVIMNLIEVVVYIIMI